MTVVGLYEHIYTGLRFWNNLKGLPSIDLYVIICNNSGSNIIKRIMRYVKQFLLASAREKLLLIKLIQKGYIKISINSSKDEDVRKWLKNLKPDIGCHGMAVLYKEDLISLFNLGILNAHIGLLPGYRGRSVMEWSMLNGSPTGISVFFVDEGIDTGKDIVLSKKVDLQGFSTVSAAKEYMFSLNNHMTGEALKVLSDKNRKPLINDVKKGKRYYVMSGLLKIVVEGLLKIAK